MEIWKDIPNFEGYYKISNLGNVKSLDRRVKRKDGIILNLKSKILKPRIDRYGYLDVKLFKNGIQTTKRIHQLLAICFLNHEPCGLEFVVDHIDCNTLNNKLDNLRIVTQQENCLNRKTKL